MVSAPRLIVWLLAAQAVVALSCLAADRDPATDPGGSAKAKIPEAVLEAFQASYPDLEITGSSQEIENGETCYEIEVEQDGHDKDFIYLEDGTLVQMEEDIDQKSLPDPVIQAVRDARPGCPIGEAERITREETIQYEVVVTCGETQFELSLSADGQLLASAQTTDEDESGDTEDESADSGQDDDRE